MRAALVLTGHLRDTCESRTGIAVVEKQVDACRAAFDGRCDVFLHTWDRLDKGPEYPGGGPVGRRCAAYCRQTMQQHNTSAWPCVTNLSTTLAPSAVAVEHQDRILDDDGDDAPWVNQSLKGFRMNMAGMLGGLDLMERHAAAMGRAYDAVVRMRADVGCRKMRGRPDFREQFMTVEGWERVQRRAAAVHNDSKELASHLRAQLDLCDRPRAKRTDFCLWSAPPTPMLRTMESFRGRLFDRLARGAPSEGGAAAALPVPDCERYLSRRGVTPFVENLLFCAAKQQGVRFPPGA